MSVKIVQDRQTGQPRGIVFVEMSTQWEGRRAVSMLNRHDFMGKNLLVKEAAEKRGFGGRSSRNERTQIDFTESGAL